MQKNQTVELDTSAHLQIGDTTIIASACYKDDGDSCFDRIVSILKEAMQNQPCS